MVTVTVFKDSAGDYKAVKSSGHAGYGQYGKDIVCAAVSVLFINTLNAIESLTKDKDAMEIIQQDDGIIHCVFQRQLGKEATLLLDAMVLGISGIQEQYSKKYLKLRFEEV